MEENKKPSNPSVYKRNVSMLEDRVTLRDHFAGLAMQSLLNQKHYDGQQLYDLRATSGLSDYSMLGDEPPKEAYVQAKESQLNQAMYVAELSFIMADAMLKQREL